MCKIQSTKKVKTCRYIGLCSKTGLFMNQLYENCDTKNFSLFHISIMRDLTNTGQSVGSDLYHSLDGTDHRSSITTHYHPAHNRFLSVDPEVGSYHVK